MSDNSPLLTPVGILASNPQRLFKAMPNQHNPGADGSFYCRIMFTAADLKTPAWAAIIKALTDSATTKFGAKAVAMIKEGGIRFPVRKDLATNGYDTDQFAAFLNLNAYADNPPALIDINAKSLESKGLLRIGCRVRASVYVTSYDMSGNKGVNLKLKSVQFGGDGPGGLTLPTRGAGGDGSGDFGALEPIAGAETAGGDDLTDLLS